MCRPLAAQIRPRACQQPTVPEPTVNDDNSATPNPPTCGSAPTHTLRPHDHVQKGAPRQAPCKPTHASQPARAPHAPSGPETPHREKNAQEAKAALGPSGSEYRAEPGSAEPPDQ